MQDTFFIQRNPDSLLRTHTSSVQVRVERRELPLRMVMPGRVFRNEAISARAHCIFHQIEGLYIDQDVSFADLKQTLLTFAEQFFGAGTRIRLRPSYFPFTEPSAEMDVYWGLETEVDKRITKGTGWLEIMGCGMVDPAVLEASGIDPNEFSGFAFGMGIERIAMLKWQIGDLRAFFENDLRFPNSSPPLSEGGRVFHVPSRIAGPTRLKSRRGPARTWRECAPLLLVLLLPCVLGMRAEAWTLDQWLSHGDFPCRRPGCRRT